MSASSRTPDDKMHRYLQRIEKLVGNRGKSPIMVKSRAKSPLSVKTSNLDNMLKYEIFLKTIIKACDINRKRHKNDFINRLKIQKQTFLPKYQMLTPAQQKRLSNQKPNQKIISFQTIHKCINTQIIRLLTQSFLTIKAYIPQKTRNNLFVNKNHRRTYSEMYADTVINTRSKSPSTIYNYEYCTPEVIKKQKIEETKSKQTRIIFNILGKVLNKKLSNSLSQIKSLSSRLLMLQLQQTHQNSEKIRQKLSQANKQVSSLSRKNNSTQKQLQLQREKLRLVTQQVRQLQNELMMVNQGQNDVNYQNLSMQNQLQSTRKQLQETKKQVLTLKDINTKNSKQLSNLRKQFDSKKRQCQAKNNQLINKTQELQSMNEQFNSIRLEYEAKLRQNKNFSKPNDSLTRQLQYQRKQIEKKYKNQQKIRKQLQRKLKSVENELEKALKQIENLQQLIAQNNQSIKKQQKQLQSNRKQLDSKQKQLEITRKQKLSNQKQIENLKKQLNDKENQIQKNITQVQAKQKQLQQFEKRLQIRQQNLVKKEKQLESQQKSLQSSKKQLQILRKKSLQKDSKKSQNQSIIHIQIDSRDSQLSSLKKQLLLSKQEHEKLKNQLLQSQRLLNQQKEKVFLLSQKQQQKENNKKTTEEQKNQKILSFQRKLAMLKIHQLLSAKFSSRKSKFFQAYLQLSNIKTSLHSKCLFIEKVVNDLLKQRKRSFMKILFSNPLKISQQKQPQVMQRSITSQIRMKSLYSSKQSLSNASIVSSNFDVLAKKINKAFSLKTALHQIYSYGFQKIDYAALLYLGISNPLNKQINKNMRESFRKILFFSYSNNQQLKNDFLQDNSQLLKKGQQILYLLKKIDNKIVFTKIQAYSLLKLNSDLRKSVKISNQSVISQKELKKQLKDFLQQRNKMYQKTYQNWQRTKQMIEDYKLASSQKAF